MQIVTNELLKYVQWNDSIAKVITVQSSYDHDPKKNLEKKDYTDLVEKAYEKGMSVWV